MSKIKLISELTTYHFLKGVEMHLYDEQFSEKYDLPRVDKASKILIIASTGRSGSHMLGHALQKSNCFGFPLEYANPSNLAEWKKRFGIDTFDKVLAEIKYRRTSSNGVFGIKIHYNQIDQFDGFKHLKEIFPDAYFVHLSRKKVLKQAVSMSIAQQTGVWISGQTPKNDNPQYSYKAIDRTLRQIIQDNASWQYILEANACNYIQMDFDFVRNNLALSIQKIAEFMKVDVDLESIPTEQITKKQSNKLNEEWENKFLTDYKGGELFDLKNIKTVLKYFI